MLLTEGESRFCCSSLQWLSALESASSVISSAGDVLGAHKFCQDGLHAGSGWQGSRTDPPVPVSQCLSKRLDLRGQPTTQRTPKHTTLHSSGHVYVESTTPVKSSMPFPIGKCSLKCILQNCLQHESPNRSQQGKISRVKKSKATRPVDAENAHKCLSVVLNVSIRSSQSQKNSYQRIPTLRTQLCNAERLCQISPKANEPYAVISLEDQSLPHASMAAKAKDGGSWLCAIEACLQILTKENNSA